MLIRVSRSHEAVFRRNLKSLPCRISSCKDFALVIEVDDDDVEEFMELADDLGMDIDEYDESLQGSKPRRPEPKPMGGEGEWRELI